MANQNEAYDFSLFEPSRKEQEQQRPAPSKQPKKKNNLIRISEEQLEKSRRIKYKPTTVIGGILFSLIVLTIMGTMILSQVQLTELTENINDANALLAEQQSITTQLQVKVESQLSLRSVEDYAQNQLGKQNAANNPITYISLANGDKAEIIQPEEKSWLDTIADAISGLLS